MCTQATLEPCKACPTTQNSLSSSFAASDCSDASSHPDSPAPKSLDDTPFLGPPLQSPPVSSTHPYRQKFKNYNVGTDAYEEVCAGCSFEIPEDFNSCDDDTTYGSPNSTRSTSSSKICNPTLRTRGDIHFPHEDTDGPIQLHKLAYTSSRHPSSPQVFAHLKRICIRTLSTEVLPRASRSGPLLFGDDNTGYTIAFVFHLRDMDARGNMGKYALLAFAGTDSYRVSRILSTVTRVFAAIVRWISAAIESRLHAEERANEELSQREKVSLHHLTPVSSHQYTKPRISRYSSFSKNSRIKVPKGLVDLVGRDRFFVELHVQFVRLLAQLERELDGW